MQCRNARELLDSFLGEDLLVETNHELLHHIGECPDCRAELAGRRHLRETLQHAFNSSDALRPRAGFAADVSARVRNAGKRSSRVKSVLYALVATLAFAAAAGLYFQKKFRGVRSGSIC